MGIDTVNKGNIYHLQQQKKKNILYLVYLQTNCHYFWLVTTCNTIVTSWYNVLQLAILVSYNLLGLKTGSNVASSYSNLRPRGCQTRHRRVFGG